MLPANNTPQIESNDVPTAQPDPTTLTCRERLLFLAHLLLLIAVAWASIGFFEWRLDKPANNPGGPLRGMGGVVLFWEWFALAPGPMLGAWSFFNTLRFVGKTIKARYGEPPPVEPDESPDAKRNDVFVAVNCAVAIGYIAYAIATDSVRTGRPSFITGGLIALSFPFILGMIPAARADVVRWTRWIWKQRSAKR